VGDSSNSFGEALENMTTNTKKAVGGTIADFTKSAANQVKGTGGISGSFTPGKQSQNPNTTPNLTGGDLFSPDKISNQQKQPGQQVPKPLTQAGQQLAQNPNAKTPEEITEIQRIEAELRSLHQKYYQDFLAKAEGRDRKKQIQEQEKVEEEKEEKMEELHKKEEKKQKDNALLRSQRATEIKGGVSG